MLPWRRKPQIGSLLRVRHVSALRRKTGVGCAQGVAFPRKCARACIRSILNDSYAQKRMIGVGMSLHDRRTTWLLAQVKPNSARIADRNLTRQGFQTFMPTQEETTRNRGKFLTTLKPLFPGYIFVAFDTAQGGWHAVNSTYGISRLVSLGKEPVAVPLDLVSQLMLRCDEAGKLRPPRILKPGEVVCVTSGPFASFVATIEAITPDKRVWVLLDLMGRQMRVAIAPDGVRRA